MMVAFTELFLYLTFFIGTTPATPIVGKIGIPSGEMGNINGLYGKPFTSSTIILGTGASTFKAHKLAAKGGFIVLDGKNGNHCPQGAHGCPHKDETGFRVYFNGTADLNTMVENGQQLYMAPTGKLGYNSAGASVPRGAILTRFVMSFSAAQNRLSGGYHWGFTGAEDSNSVSNAMWACSGGDAGDDASVKTVYAGVPGFDKKKFEHCDQINPGFTPLETEGPSAYEYE